MTADPNELHDLWQRIARLSREDQIHLVEGILSDIRKSHFTDHEAHAREMAEMAADMELQERLYGKELPYGERLHEAG